MILENNYNLLKLNTFGISVNAKFFVELNSEEDLKELLATPEFKNNKKIFLGGGSNVLFTKDFDGIVILNKVKGIAPTKVGVPTGVGKECVYIRAMGGESWHGLVLFAVDKGYWGIENLSLIPGTVGAAPMQNIGAYGAELKDTLFSVETFEIESGEKKIFSCEECELGYRDSVFKNKLKGKYFISAVTLKLSKTPKPNVSYKILSDYLEKTNKTTTLKNISDAVAEIRRSKLPDPKIIGNAGSFFKNVFVTKTELEILKKKYPEIPHFEEENMTSPPTPLLAKERGEIQYKIPAGWLIEQCGWKGRRMGNVGVHDKQALVLVNHGGAKGEEIIELANKIIASVKEKFGLELKPEVNIV
ncbi:UDP-N-acetylmuramate dehydrogenase [Candidatus Nomurabacteria bacterium]|nr:UDP-N-acetylmuramate dehydrogenase [Candidatus Nomurabacteria bacterium]